MCVACSMRHRDEVGRGTFAGSLLGPREAWKDRWYWGEGESHRGPRAPPSGGHVLTTCTHSMRGSRTDWFPERLTTQAGVSGVASSRAITASMPILLL